MSYTLYKITNLRNNKNYVGLTTDLPRRMKLWWAERKGVLA